MNAQLKIPRSSGKNKAATIIRGGFSISIRMRLLNRQARKFYSI